MSRLRLLYGDNRLLNSTLRLSRGREDQPVVPIYPKQIRTEEYPLNDRRTVHIQEDECKWHPSTLATLGYSGPGEVEKYGACSGPVRFRSSYLSLHCPQAPMYYRGAHAALLLYDITNPSSFDAIHGWIEGAW